jgi:hypothetical protein
VAFVLSFACALAYAGGDPRFEGAGMTFQYPGGWTFEATSDISAESAARGNAAVEAGKKPAVRTALVLLGAKKIGDGELENEAANWHAAHVKNRSAWGMRSEGGTPRDLVKVGGKRAVRYRDQVGSALGATEQTLTCAMVSARLGCVIVGAAPEARDAADALSAQILTSLRAAKR